MQNPPSDCSKGGKKIAMKKKNYRLKDKRFSNIGKIN